MRRDGHTVVTTADGKAVLRLSRQHQPDLLALDLMLPTISGLAVYRRIHSERRVPLIMLTARRTEKDRLIGLGIGADASSISLSQLNGEAVVVRYT